MNYNEFKEALKREIEKRLEGKAAVSFRTISKMNQVEKESIQIEKREVRYPQSFLWKTCTERMR